MSAGVQQGAFVQLRSILNPPAMLGLLCAALEQVIVLVGTGWSYMTPFLKDREKRILMVVIPLQVLIPP